MVMFQEFRYLDQLDNELLQANLGRSERGLLNTTTLEPNPDYYM
jgi:hypothetical protein